jgi:hypothetical protein
MTHLVARKRPFYVNNKDLYNSYLQWYEDIEIAEKNGVHAFTTIPPTIVDAIMRISNKLSFHPNFINYSFRDEMIADALYDCIKFAKKFNPKKNLHKAILCDINGKLGVKDVLIGRSSGLQGTITFSNTITGQVSLKMTQLTDFTIGEVVGTSTGNYATISEITSHFANNPFAYLTTQCYNAFLRRIDIEKKQSYVKAKLISETPVHEFFESIESDDIDLQTVFSEFVNENSENLTNNEPQALKRKRKKLQESLDSELREEKISCFGLETFYDADPHADDSDDAEIAMMCGYSRVGLENV